MSDNPLVSIIITYYNYKNYIYNCLNSCFKQTYDNIEIIVVDDASPDPISKISDIVLVRHEKNLGYSAAKNTGIRIAKGEYITFIDADDILTLDSIKNRMNVMLANPKIDFVHGIALRWYGGNDTRGFNPKTYCHAQGRLYKKELHKKYGLYYEPLRSMADKEWVYRIGVHNLSPLPKLVKEKKINEVVAWYRKHETQMHRTRKQQPKTNKRINKIFNDRIKQLKKEGITKENTLWL